MLVHITRDVVGFIDARKYFLWPWLNSIVAVSIPNFVSNEDVCCSFGVGDVTEKMKHNKRLAAENTWKE